MLLLLVNLIFGGLLIGGAAYFWYRANQIRHPSSSGGELSEANHTLVSVSVPKNNDRTPQAAEQMFAALHGIFRRGTKDQPKISLELVSRQKTITFYLYFPTELKEFVISQIYAQYPNVEVREIPSPDDYTNLDPNKKLAATELTLNRPSVYPIKTFQNFEVDPLAAITGVLSSLTDYEEAWIQMIISPVDDDWQERGIEEIKTIKDPPPKHKGIGELIRAETAKFAFDLASNLVAGPPGSKDDKKSDDKKDEITGPAKQAITGIEEKISHMGYAVKIRLLFAGADEIFARAKLEQVLGAFKQFNSPNLNSFSSAPIVSDRAAVELFAERAFGTEGLILNIVELASLYHFPSETVATPTIAWAGSKKGEPPTNLPLVGSVPADELTIFSETNFRSEVRKFGIKRQDRRLHMYIIGKTGTGKSTMLENMIIDDIREGRGVAVVDPHGELIKHVLEFIPEHRVEEVIYFNPADHEHPIGFNLLENVDPEQKNIVASGVVGVLEKIFGEISWGPRLEYILRNVILALLEYPGSTFLGIMRILTDSAYRRLVLNEVRDPVIRDFFINEFEKYDPKFRTEAIAPIQNKVGQFLSASTIRNIIGQPKSTIDVSDIMNSGKILLVDLSIGRIGEDNSALLGAMLITKIQLAAMNRASLPEEERRDFYLYVDEFQNFATESFATILSEARKYRLNLIMANQYITQMPEKVANAVFGNVGTMVAFRVGASDAGALEKEYEPIFDVNDLVNLDNYQIYLKMAIDGVTAPAFSASTLPPPANPTKLTETVIAESRRRFTRERSEVEDYITDWSESVDLGKMAKDTPEAPRPEEAPLGPDLSAVKIEEPQLPPGSKVEIIKDRFDRSWYAIADRVRSISPEAGEREQEIVEPAAKAEEEIAPVEEAPASTDKDFPLEPIVEDKPPSESRGEGEKESEDLITWDQAEELGIQPAGRPDLSIDNLKTDQLLPVKELD